MKVIKYDVKLKIEVKDIKKEEQELKNSLIKAFTYKKKDGNLVSPKITTSDSSIEVEGLKFRKLINVRKFISQLADDYDARCGKLNKADNAMTIECTGSGAKLYFEIRKERIVKPKKPKQEVKGEKKEEKKEEEKKS